MKHQRHFDTREAAQREAILIWRMIADIDRPAAKPAAKPTAKPTPRPSSAANH